VPAQQGAAATAFLQPTGNGEVAFHQHRFHCQRCSGFVKLRLHRMGDRFRVVGGRAGFCGMGWRLMGARRQPAQRRQGQSQN
jgi:hypothetical protein